MSNNDTFQWTDELVAQCFEYIREDTAGVLTPVGVRKNVEYFKASHTQQEPERIEVTSFLNEGASDNGNWYKFHIAFASEKGCPSIKSIPEIKEAIEKVLNEPLPPKPQVLFTTQDGVPVHEGDEYWIMESSNWDVYKAPPAHEKSGMYSERKYFSTKEKADEWVFMNKPCLSLQWVLDKINGLISERDFDYVSHELARFAQQKQPTT